MALKVLVVDDDDSLVFMLKEMLLADGYDVQTASDSSLVLERLSQFRPDLLILDYNMPGFSGRQILDHVRAGSEDPTLPFLFLTGDPPEKILPGGGNAMTRCLTKPIALEDLSAAVQKMFRKK